MTLIQIKSRFCGRVSYEYDVPDGVQSGDQIKVAVAAAVRSQADLSGVNLSGADLSGADLSGVNLSVADLSGVNLSGADLIRADLNGVNLSGADLSGADLSGADLSWADLSGVGLSGVNLSGADLRGADLSGVNLSVADLSGVNLSGADLSGADLSGQRLADCWLRSDGYRFTLLVDPDGTLRVQAGCRNLTMAEAVTHWKNTRGGTPLGEETMLILDRMKRIATLRGWTTQNTEAAATDAVEETPAEPAK